MKKKALSHLLMLFFIAGACPSWLQARTLSFEERVRVQAAIERVYYSHQLGTSDSFEQAIPRSVLERKVTNYLQQSAALEQFWQRPVTSEMLQREMERMAGRTRMPDRLRELFAALANDPFLIQECLARPALTARLLESYVAFDDRIQRPPREAARQLQEQLSRGRRDTDPPGISRSIIDLVEVKPGEGRQGKSEARPGEPDAEGVSRLELEAEEFGAWKKKLPGRIGEAGRLREEQDAFVTEILLESAPGHLRVIRYQVPKRSRGEWWLEVGNKLDPASVAAVASDLVALPSVGSLSSQPCACDSTNFWDDTSLNDMPEPRTWPSSVWTGSLMIVWGGRVSFDTNTGGRYDPATDTWTSTSIVDAPAPRNLASLFWTGNRVLVWGGTITAPISVPGPINSGGLYDPVSDSWTSIGSDFESPSQSLRNYSTIWTGSELILWGGYNSFFGTFPSTGYRYNPSSDSWTSTSTVGAPPGRMDPAAIWTGSEMILWSGGDFATNFTDGYRYSPAGDSWLPISTLSAPSPRRDAFAVWTGSKMLVVSGCNGTNVILHSCGGGAIQNDGGMYDPANDTWSAISTTNAPVPRRERSMVWTGSKMILWGGQTSEVYFNDGAAYAPGTDTWTPTSTLGAPAIRATHTASWTGSEMIVWGGNGEAANLNTGGRYNSATNSWVPTSLGPGPAPRAINTALWTGTSMLIWGGQASPDGSVPIPMNSGGKYDPALDSWSSITTSGAPTPRNAYAAVWTGSRLIIWGGSVGAVRVATGARYDPVADVWTPTSLVGAPPARSRHAGIWSGNKLIVWGGFSGTSNLNDGGRYDPTSDTWLGMSQLSAPQAVSYPMAVWTGAHMVVWGGSNTGNPNGVNTGGLYDPIYDVWRPTSLTSAPSGRLNGTAIWTGKEMIIWGGGGGGNYTDTGGRYSPETNTWQPTSLVGAPLAREYHTAVWAGNRMLVWGGYYDLVVSGNPFLDSGGIYDPVSDSWDSMITAGAPVGREGHSAVWTGEKMLTFGGWVLQYLNGGGSYCGLSAPHYYFDADTDGVGNTASSLLSCSQPANYVTTPGDCADTNAAIWAAPSEALSVQFVNPTTLQWSAPAQPGATSVLYDAIRSGNAADFVGGTTCLATNTASLSVSEATLPALGTTLNYLVRAQNACPSGIGPLGLASSGLPRAGLDCP